APDGVLNAARHVRSHRSRLHIRDVKKLHRLPNTIAEWQEFRLQGWPYAKAEHLRQQFTATILGLEPGVAVRLVLLLIAFVLYVRRNSSACSINNQLLETDTRFRLQRLKILVLNVETDGEGAQALAGLVARAAFD